MRKLNVKIMRIKLKNKTKNSNYFIFFLNKYFDIFIFFTIKKMEIFFKHLLCVFILCLRIVHVGAHSL